MLYIMLDPHWQGSGSGFSWLLARSPAKRASNKRLLAWVQRNQSHFYRGAGAAEMWFLSVLPYNSNTNYYKIITEAVFAKCFAKRLQLYQKKSYSTWGAGALPNRSLLLCCVSPRFHKNPCSATGPMAHANFVQKKFIWKCVSLT
jgi:hypothetical protein